MGRVALVTGASAGLGAEFARQLRQRGHRLVLVARRKARLDALAAELGETRVVAIDLSQPGAAAELMANIAAHDEVVDLLVNNAGFGLVGRFADLSPARQRQMIDLNCGALTELCREVAPSLVALGGGAILNVASTAAFQPGPGMAAYFATKSYVLSLTEALHEELKPHHVRVTALCPGPTRTEFGEIAGFHGGRMFDRAAMNSDKVVRIGLRGLDRNKAVVIPGVFNFLLAESNRLAPRWLSRRIAGSIKNM